MGKVLMIAAFLLIVLTLGKWGMDSKDYGEIVYYTKTSKLAVEKSVDPLFGTSIEKTVTTPGHWLGLLDVEFPFGALPICGACFAMGVVGFFVNRAGQKKRAAL